VRATVEVTEDGQPIKEVEAERHKRNIDGDYSFVYIPPCFGFWIIIFILVVWSVCVAIPAYWFEGSSRCSPFGRRPTIGTRSSSASISCGVAGSSPRPSDVSIAIDSGGSVVLVPGGLSPSPNAFRCGLLKSHT
jgi:hypothetical protein